MVGESWLGKNGGGFTPRPLHLGSERARGGGEGCFMRCQNCLSHDLRRPPQKKKVQRRRLPLSPRRAAAPGRSHSQSRLP